MKRGTILKKKITRGGVRACVLVCLCVCVCGWWNGKEEVCEKRLIKRDME